MKHILFVSLLAFAMLIGAQEGAVGQEEGQYIEDKVSVVDLKLGALVEKSMAASSYRAGNYAEAQRHVGKALEIDTEDAGALMLIANCIRARYRPGIETPENIALALEAINAYQRALSIDSANAWAYQAVAALYGAIKEDELRRSWLLQLASNAAIPDESRAEAYTELAKDDLRCSSEITDQAESKEATTKNGRITFRQVMPKDRDQFFKAQQCAMHGLEMAEMAISLYPQMDRAWSFKAYLLTEMVKLSEMNEQDNLKAEYARQAGEVQRRTTELSEANQSNQAVGNDRSQSSQSDTSTTNSGSVINGRAISLPKPTYPPGIRDAHASGTVTVRVLIDETGKVIEAYAVNGHPLLQAAAVEAARQAQFSPTILSGQPVKVSSVITYNFVP